MSEETKEKIIAFLGLGKSRLGVISTVNKECRPESAVVYFTFDKNLNIYFATRDNSRKYKNILQNKNVSFTISTENPPQTIQLDGVASIEHDAKGQKHLFQELVELAAVKHFSPPISQQTTGGLQFIKISPAWIRFGNFEARKHGNVFEEIKL